MEVKTEDTTMIVEHIVNDIDEIVRMVRFPGWQNTSAGEREVQKALRKTAAQVKTPQRPRTVRPGLRLHLAVLLTRRVGKILCRQITFY